MGIKTVVKKKRNEPAQEKSASQKETKAANDKNNETVSETRKHQPEPEENIVKEKKQKNNASETASSKKKEKSHKYFAMPLWVLNLLDALSSVVFFVALIFALKPSLLGNVNFDFNLKIVQMAKFIGSQALLIIGVSRSDLQGGDVASVLILALLLIYFVLKAVVVLLSGNHKKIVSALLLAMMAVSCFVLTKTFLLFVIFYVLLYASFELVTDFPWHSIWRKVFMLIVLVFGLYVALHIVIDEQLYKAFEDFIKIFTEKLALTEKIKWI